MKIYPVLLGGLSYVLMILTPTLSISAIFYESFESIEEIQNNGGIFMTSEIEITEGVIGNSGNFSDSKAICYPLQDHFSAASGTLQFLTKIPSNTYLGFFDIGTLGNPNSWGIFKNLDHIIMEVKNSQNVPNQAWTSAPIPSDDQWHLISAIWEKRDITTYFKICFDGNCKQNYDGIAIDNSVDMSKNFCIGWSGWYGYSQAIIDELSISDHAKSDSEILETYQRYFPERIRPVIGLLGDASIIVELGGQYADPGATAADSSGNDISEQIVQTGAVNTAVPGTYRIAFNVTAENGFTAKEKVRFVHVVDLEVKPIQRAFEHLQESMDRYHNTFSVYNDFVSGGNHASPSGWMGSSAELEVNQKWDSYTQSGSTCIKITTPGEWAGIQWLQPDGNWATVANAGYDLTGATTVSFYAKGQSGGEVVDFFAGGVAGEYPDSIQPAVSRRIALTNTWERYSLDLSGKDLSYVIGPFAWKTEFDSIFYLDDVVFDLKRPDSPRFIQSYEITDLDNEIAISNTSYTYDNALALLSFLYRGTTEDLWRAKIIADAFVYALAHDRTYSDGRLRNAYMSGDLSDPFPGTAKLPGWWDTAREKWFEDKFSVSTHTGNIAWAMLALITYYESQGGAQYLEAAKEMGEWVELETKDTRGSGGYTGGYEGWEQTSENPDGPKKLLYKATEHNIDLYPAFIRLYKLTGEIKWKNRAEHAKLFVQAMWDTENHHFWTGVTDDGVTINKDNIPVDLQAWASMAIPDEKEYQLALQWAETNCFVKMDGFEGFDFNNDLDGIWFEGTAQMAVAYQIAGDLTAANNYRTQLQKAQTSATNANGKGIVAASRESVSTGFDWEYFSRLHIGATAWFLFAEMQYNPYWHIPSYVLKADVNNDATVDVMDAILSLQVSAGIHPPSKVFVAADANGDGKIGTEEAVHSLMLVSGLK